MFFSFLLILVIVIYTYGVAFAEEIKEPCELTITVTDMLEECDGVVSLTITTQAEPLSLTLAKEYWGSENAQTAYSQAFGTATVSAVVSTAGWEVVDAETLNPVGAFEISPKGKIELNFVIIPTKDNEKFGAIVDTLTTNTIVGDVLSQFGLDGETTAPTNTSNANASESVEGAEEVYKNFLDATEIMKTDSSWQATIDLYKKIVGQTYKNTYLDTVKGATEETWNALSGYDIFVYIESYLRYSSMVTAESDVNYFERGEDGIKALEKNVTPNLNGVDSEKIIEAYDAIVRWQANYWNQYNFPYNFITRKSYADETGISTVEETEETTEFTDKEIEEILEGSEEKEQGVWDNFLDKISKYKITLIIIAVLVIAGLVARRVLKKNTVDEMTDDGK